MRVQKILLGALLLNSSLWALNKNQSIEFVQSANRNASTDADAAFHNPAGLGFLRGDGWHVGVASQVVLQNRSITEESAALQFYGPGTYDGEIRVWSFPTMQAVYRKNDLALYLHGGPLAGGGKGTYNQGLPKFDNLILGFANQIAGLSKSAVEAGYDQQLALNNINDWNVTENSVAGILYDRDLVFTGDEKTLGATLGAVYKVHPKASVSAAYRFVRATASYQGRATPSNLRVVFQGSQGLSLAGISGTSVDSTLNVVANHVLDSLWRDISVDVKASGVAHGVVLGMNVQPHRDWNVGVRLEWNSPLELENESSTILAPDALRPYLASFEKGAKIKVTEPMVLAGGVSWQALESVLLESSWTYGFFSLVDRGGEEKNYHNSVFGGLGARWQFHRKMTASAGFAHDWAFREDVARLETEFDMPTSFYTAGLGLQATSRLRLDAGVMLGLAEDQNGVSVASGAPQKMSQEHVNFGLGLQWSP